MTITIAFFRGINVGGSSLLPMAELVDMLSSLGLSAIRTYIQSGNVVFAGGEPDRTALAQRITHAFQQRRGFAPALLLLTPDELRRAIDENPFHEAQTEPKTLHLFFLAAAPARPDLEKIARLARPDERYALHERVFYLHAPHGVGRSKLAAGVEKALGVPVTARNWQTVTRVMDIAAPGGPP